MTVKQLANDLGVAATHVAVALYDLNAPGFTGPDYWTRPFKQMAETKVPLGYNLAVAKVIIQKLQKGER